MLFKASVAVIIICIVTALVCGGIILLNQLGFFKSTSAVAEYHTVGKMYNTLRAATDQAEVERAQGRAGCVLSCDDGFFVVYSLYSSESDARSVAEKLNCETRTVSVGRVDFEENAENCAKAMDTLRELVTETEKIWRDLDEYKTSESLSVKTLKNYVAVISGYVGLENGVGELCGRVCEYLTEAAEGGSVNVSAGAKYVSAATAISLSEYCRAMQ